MKRQAWVFLPFLLHVTIALAVVLYALDTTRVVDASLAANQLVLDAARNACRVASSPLLAVLP